MGIWNLSQSATPFLAKFEIAPIATKFGGMIDLVQLYRMLFKSRKKT